MATLYYGAGTGTYGTMPYGTAMAPISALDAIESVAENRVRLTFNTPPKSQNWGTNGDVHDPRNYTIEGVAGTQGLNGEAVHPVRVVRVEVVDALTVDLILDRPMTAWPANYRVDVDGLREAGTNFPFAAQSFVLLAQFKGIPMPVFDLIVNNRDIANPQTRAALYDPLPIDGQPTDAMLGVFPVDSTGDVALDEGLASYQKRCIRRLTTRRGAFAHLPGYGVGLPEQVKQLSRPGSREALAIDAEEQLRQEPETRAVAVTVKPDPRDPSVIFFGVRLQTTIGRTLTFGVRARA